MQYKKRAEIFKKLRKNRNLTQQKLAEDCDCNVRTIKRAENPKHNIDKVTWDDYYNVFNKKEEQELLKSIDESDKLFNELTSENNYLMLTEISDANEILNGICQGYIDLTGGKNGRTYDGEEDNFSILTYQHIDKNEALDLMNIFMNNIKEYRIKYRNIVEESIDMVEFTNHNFNYPNEIVDLKLETAFKLSKSINLMRTFGITYKTMEGIGVNDGEFYSEEVPTGRNYDIRIFANFNGRVRGVERCPILYICDVLNNSNVSQKNKDKKIIRLEKN